MTTLDNSSTLFQKPENNFRAPPEITSEEDIPLPHLEEASLEEISEKQFNRSLSIFKHVTAKNLIVWCMLGITITAAINIFVTSELIIEAFDFFKLLALTTTGYLFGTSKNS